MKPDLRDGGVLASIGADEETTPLSAAVWGEEVRVCGLAARGATRLPWPARYRTGRQRGRSGEKLRCDKLRVRIRGRIAGNRNRILRFGGVMSTDIEIQIPQVKIEEVDNSNQEMDNFVFNNSKKGLL